MSNPNTLPVDQEAEAMHQAEQMAPAPEQTPPIAIEINIAEQGAEEITVHRRERLLYRVGEKALDLIGVPREGGDIPRVMRKVEAERAQDIARGVNLKSDNPHIQSRADQLLRESGGDIRNRWDNNASIFSPKRK